jgi:hypothetical protein
VALFKSSNITRKSSDADLVLTTVRTTNGAVIDLVNHKLKSELKGRH